MKTTKRAVVRFVLTNGLCAIASYAGAQSKDPEAALLSTVEQVVQQGQDSVPRTTSIQQRIQRNERYLAGLTERHAKLREEASKTAEHGRRQLSLSAMRLVRTIGQIHVDRLRLWQLLQVSNLAQMPAEKRTQGIRDAVKLYEANRSEARNAIDEIFRMYAPEVTEPTLRASFERLRANYRKAIDRAPV